MRPLAPGDRVEVVAPIDDPAPIQIGTTGTITEIANRNTRLEQIYVDWDRSPNGETRSLILVPQDYHCVRRIP